MKGRDVIVDGRDILSQVNIFTMTGGDLIMNA